MRGLIERGAGGPRREATLSPQVRERGPLALQRLAGNRAVSSLLATQRACCSSCASGGTCRSQEESAQAPVVQRAVTEPVEFTNNRFILDDRLTRASANNTPLKQGAKGAAVSKVQMALIDLAIVVRGGADGDYGGGTVAAVKEFQRRESLDRDGACGHDTLARLDQVAGPPPASIVGPTPPGPNGTVPANGLSATQATVANDALVAGRKATAFTIEELQVMREELPKRAAEIPAFRANHVLGDRAVRRWLLVDDPTTTAYRSALNRAITVIGRHYQGSLQERFTKEALGTPFCPNGGVGAATAGFHIGLCDPFFTHSAVCQRDEVVHEIFHSLGIHHGGTARDPNACVARASMSPAQALDSCDNLSMLISETVSGTFDACGKSCFGDDPRVLS